ncbi:MAG: hypothetical protein ACKOTF_01725, partial [Opitutaceae bacterium]
PPLRRLPAVIGAAVAVLFAAGCNNIFSPKHRVLVDAITAGRRRSGRTAAFMLREPVSGFTAFRKFAVAAFQSIRTRAR